MRRRCGSLIAVAGAAIAAAALAACSLTTSLDGFTSTLVYADGAADGTASGTDGGARADSDVVGPDAGTDAFAAGDADGGVIGGANIHPQSTFENADDACEPGWGAFQASLTKNAVAHSGSASCRVCMNSGVLDYYTADDGGASGGAVVGAKYRAEAWVRTAPGTAAPGPGRIFLRNFTTAGGFQALEGKNSDPEQQMDDTWRLWSIELPITKANGTINVFVGVTSKPSSCFLLDDVTLRRVN